MVVWFRHPVLKWPKREIDLGSVLLDPIRIHDHEVGNEFPGPVDEDEDLVVLVFLVEESKPTNDPTLVGV